MNRFIFRSWLAKKLTASEKQARALLKRMFVLVYHQASRSVTNEKDLWPGHSAQSSQELSKLSAN